jgi:hypothetical protein
MTTKLSEPKYDSWINADGWVFPNYEDKKFEVDPFGPLKDFQENTSPIASFEFQQAIFGQYRYFYHEKAANSIHKQCLRLCIRKDSLLTSNLTQEDKLCARECILNENTFTKATSAFIEKVRAVEFLDSSIPFDNVQV